MTADNFNLFGANGDSGVVGFIPGPTDIVPAPGVMLAAILGPLADNGGPTQTHALVFGSPASDASRIDKHCPVTDQRGVLRPQGAACDIGALDLGVEPDPFASPTPAMRRIQSSSSVSDRPGVARRAAIPDKGLHYLPDG